MKTKQMIAVGAIATLTAFTPQTFAAEAEVEVKTPRLQGETELRRDPQGTPAQAEVDTSDRIQEQRQNRVMRSNKASGLLGMEVRNPQNEKLGEIKDLVLDLKSGKISYAVLAVGGFLGLGEKLLAVPVDVFQVSEQDGNLVLNADKAKIQAAPGFAATNWPLVDDPNLEARTFWMEEETATGAPARTETERREGQLDVDIETDKDSKIYTDAEKDKEIRGEAEVDIDN